MSNILKGLNEGRSYGRDSWDSNMPGYQGDYGGAANWGRRNREDDEHHEIDARLAAQHAQKQEYERNGKFWLKLKDSQRHLPAGPFTGKQAANTAAIELLKQQPELKGNLLITAYGPDETKGVDKRVLDEAIDESWVQAYKALEANGGEPDATKPALFIKQLAMIAKDAGIQSYYISNFVKNYISDSIKAFNTAELVRQAMEKAPSITDIKKYSQQSQAADTSFAQQQSIGQLQHELSAQQLINQNNLEKADAEQLVAMDAEARFAIQAMKQELSLNAKERLHKLQMEIDAGTERKEIRDHELKLAQAGYAHEINVITTTAEGEYKKAKLEADYQIHIKQLTNIDNAGERQNKLDQINAEKAKQIQIIDAETNAKIREMQKGVEVEQQQQAMEIEKAFMMTFNPIWGAALTAAHAAGATWDAGINNLKKALRMLASPIMPKPQSVKEELGGAGFTPAVGEEILWRPRSSKMIPVPVTVVAVAPDKLKIKLQSPRMIQNYGKDTIVIRLDNSDISPKKSVAEEKQRLDPSCWKGYKKQGTKMKGDTRVNNCVPVKKESAIMKGLVDEDRQGDK